MGDRSRMGSWARWLHGLAGQRDALRQRSAEVARVLRFTTAVLWQASPLLTLCLLVLGWATGVTPLLQIWATAGLVDALTRAGSTGASPAAVADAAPLAPLLPFLPWIAALIGVLVVNNAVEAVTPLLSAHLRERLGETLERRLHEKELALGLAVFENPEYYDRLERARQATGDRLVFTLGIVREFLSGLIGAVGIACVVGQINAFLALLLVAGSFPVALLGARISEEFVRINYRQSPLKRKLAYWRELSTKRASAAEVRLFRLAGHLLERWRTLQEELIQELHAARRRHVGAQLKITWATELLDGLVIAGIVYAAARGTISAGVLVAVLYALRQFDGFRSGFQWQIETMNRVYADLRYIPEFLDTPGEERAPGEGSPAILPLREGIRFDEVSFTYPGATEPALRGVSLHIRPGERLALVGENGAGKSTLARLLLGLYEPTGGRILVDGVDLRELDPTSWRAHTAAVFQSFVQYQLTARENIGFGDVRHLNEEDVILAAARRSGAHEVVQTLPSVYETLLGKGYVGAEDLSIGQWQKLALARAYLRDAGILVLDEPAASLDALAELEVYRQFSSASEGKTVLLISHRLGSARLADRIVVLEAGRVVQIGRHEELIAAGGPYAEMYALQAEWYREPAGASRFRPRTPRA